MKRQRVEFRLSMPCSPSWNGKWSGEDRNYTLVRDVPEERLAVMVHGSMSYSYPWSDGWVARVDARIMAKGERPKKSDGFCGYDWMVDSIIKWGAIYTEAPKAELAKAGGQ